MVDSFSKWLEIYRCKHPTVRNTKMLDEVFSCFIVPNTVVSNNGTMFTRKEFKDYCYSLAIDHITRTAYNPRSNGQAGRFVDMFKRALRKKITESKPKEKGIQKFLAVHRINPNLSPAEMFACIILSIWQENMQGRWQNFLQKLTCRK